MHRSTVESLKGQLKQRRAALVREIDSAEADLRFISQDRDADLEERGREETTARLLDRLDNRSMREIEEIDIALRRIEAGGYGVCSYCGRRIGVARLRALPATNSCRRCASRADEAASVEREEPRSGPGPDEGDRLSDRELEESLREHLRLDHRVDQAELRIVCRHGVLYLDGALASEVEHQILRKLATDVIGFREVVDRLRIAEILFERRVPPGSSLDPGPIPRSETPATGNLSRSVEEGLDYLPPDEPPPDEE